MKKCIIQIETLSNMPLTTSQNIICIGVKNLQENTIEIFNDKDETHLLTKFLQQFTFQRYEEVIGYDLFPDINCLIVRCLLSGLPMKTFLDSKKTDLRNIIAMKAKNTQKINIGSLHQWGILLTEKRKPNQNKTNSQLLRENNQEAIIENIKYSLDVIQELYNRINRCLFNQKLQKENNR